MTAEEQEERVRACRIAVIDARANWRDLFMSESYEDMKREQDARTAFYNACDELDRALEELKDFKNKE